MTRTKERAVVVAVQLPSISDHEFQSSIQELRRLAKTLGLEVLADITQRRPSLTKSAAVGSGKLKEIARYTGGSGEIPSGAKRKPHKAAYRSGPDRSDEPEELEAAEEEVEEEEIEIEALPEEERAGMVLVDHDLSPSQARNLEHAVGAEVFDRTAVILAIFQRHARTREAQIEVEIARLNYLAPRLRELGGGGDRQRGGIGGRGAGESAMELDRRKVRDRIAELKGELASIEQATRTRAERRQSMSVAALVGYTNAGKSSLMRALTGSDVLVEDKLFATLDTTVRALKPETKPRILISDTVGFIKKLPHGLVASFRATLEIARDADLLLQVVDCSDGAFRSHIDVTREALQDIGAGDQPTFLLLNKVDRLTPAEADRLRDEYPEAFVMSAKESEDITHLYEQIVAFFEKDMIEEEIFVPYHRQAIVNDVHQSCRVLSESYEDLGVRMKIRAPLPTVARFRE